MQVSVTILQQYHKPVNVWLSIRKGAREEVAAAKRSFDHPSTAFLSLQVGDILIQAHHQDFRGLWGVGYFMKFKHVEFKGY